MDMRSSQHDPELDQWSDEDAMGRVINSDDAQAFAMLVERWRGAIERLCARMLGDPAGAEDLAQEVFTRLYHRRADFHSDRGRFSSFLWRIALNRCYDELRRRRSREYRKERAREMPQAQAVAGAALKEVMSSEEGALVRRALADLPEHYRAVLVLRHYQGMKFREIAEVLEIPHGTVCSRMAEGLSLLAGELSEVMDFGANHEGGGHGK
jgi:RNA polymerase sigma-70 factor (ECF subfamily)